MAVRPMTVRGFNRLRLMVEDQPLAARDEAVREATGKLVELGAAIREWVERDETAETGPTHPTYVLADVGLSVLLAMLANVGASQALTTLLPASSETVLIVSLSESMLRDEVCGRFARLEADAAGEAII